MLTCSQIAAGYAHSMVLTDSGELYTFGVGTYGQLGLNGTNMEIDPQKVQHTNIYIYSLCVRVVSWWGPLSLRMRAAAALCNVYICRIELLGASLSSRGCDLHCG